MQMWVLQKPDKSRKVTQRWKRFYISTPPIKPCKMPLLSAEDQNRNGQRLLCWECITMNSLIVLTWNWVLTLTEDRTVAFGLYEILLYLKPTYQEISFEHKKQRCTISTKSSADFRQTYWVTMAPIFLNPWFWSFFCQCKLLLWVSGDSTGCLPRLTKTTNVLCPSPGQRSLDVACVQTNRKLQTAHPFGCPQHQI